MPSRARRLRQQKANARRAAEVGLSDGAGKVRLQRVMAEAGVAARRVCEEMIEQGRVQVNGETVTRLPCFVNPATDRVLVEGRLLAITKRSGTSTDHGKGGPAKRGESEVGLEPSGRSPGEPAEDAIANVRRVYVMLNKPARVMSTMADEGGRTTVADLVSYPGVRLYPVGRLDFHSSGLVLMTNDGQLAHRLTHASFGIPRTYRLTVKGMLNDEGLMEIATGLLPRSVKVDPSWWRATEQTPGGRWIEPPKDRPFRVVTRSPGAPRAASFEQQRELGGPRTVIDVVIGEGRRGKLPDMLKVLGQRVGGVSLVGIGPLELRGVAPGNWRELDRGEVRLLRRAVGLSSFDSAAREMGRRENDGPARERTAPRRRPGGRPIAPPAGAGADKRSGPEVPVPVIRRARVIRPAADGGDAR